MKKLKRSAPFALATIVASIGLTFGVSAPASASPASGWLYCPSNMSGYVSFKSASPGAMSWYFPGVTGGYARTWTNRNAYHSYYATRTGTTNFMIWDTNWKLNTTITSLYATCKF